MSAGSEPRDSGNAVVVDEAGEQTRAGSAPYAYFYYVTPGQTMHGYHGKVEAFLIHAGDVNSSAKIEDLIPIWTSEIKSGARKPVGWGLGDLKWRWKSYLVVVLDAPGYKFGSAEGLVITGGRHTFTGKTLTQFTTTDGSKVQAIYCINHVKKKNGKPWKDAELETFYPLKLDVLRGPSVHPFFSHDDTGTNTGPPPP
ncbi:hypothetical protein [Sphingomonas sp. LM7]|uniref:hypothetical protein n=1 Tax=Sphingomonas sp. LM7 TaxID=1938607 RepID=UPI000983EAA8|nr:hypothetical protein [Sphingomonas sp. LM7]AQR73561.1 hypothetical protein BXU08_07825 [Sphingomonas sp. LM7]